MQITAVHTESLVEGDFCLYVCPIITKETYASNFDWGTRESHKDVLSLVLRF